MNSDFLDFEIEDMYFDKPLDEKAEQLINQASEMYGTDKAELLLLRALVLSPEHLSVLVALYRYYYYQHRLDNALRIVQMALRVSARQLFINEDWRIVESHAVAAGAYQSVGLVRFYLLALKAAGFVMVRLGQFENGIAAMKKVVEHDPDDRLKTKDLLNMIQSYSYSQEHENVKCFATG